jgi:hypothetical protein
VRSRRTRALIHPDSPALRPDCALPLRKSARSLGLSGETGLPPPPPHRMCFHVKKFS